MNYYGVGSDNAAFPNGYARTHHGIDAKSTVMLNPDGLVDPICEGCVCGQTTFLFTDWQMWINTERGCPERNKYIAPEGSLAQYEWTR